MNAREEGVDVTATWMEVFGVADWQSVMFTLLTLSAECSAVIDMSSTPPLPFRRLMDTNWQWRESGDEEDD